MASNKPASRATASANGWNVQSHERFICALLFGGGHSEGTSDEKRPRDSRVLSRVAKGISLD